MNKLKVKFVLILGLWLAVWGYVYFFFIDNRLTDYYVSHGLKWIEMYILIPVGWILSAAVDKKLKQLFEGSGKTQLLWGLRIAVAVIGIFPWVAFLIPKGY